MGFKDTFSDLKNLDADDLQRIGTTPAPLRGFFILLGCAVVIGGMTKFMTMPQFDKLEAAERTEVELRQKFDREQAKAANRDAYAEQLEEMKKTFSVMVRQLPNKTDIESLLVDLSQTSVASGLEVQFFKPQNEVPKDFYAEYPIRISVVGQYHQFGQFISGLAALPRIVTLSNIDINSLDNASRDNPNAGTSKFKMDLMATTYRYIEEEQ